MGIFSKTPFEKKINEYIGGFLWKGYYKDLLKLNGLYKPYFGKSDMCIGNDIQHILKKRFELEGWDVSKFEFEFYLLLKELIYINNNEGFTNKVCSECNNSLSNMHIVYCPNCSHDFLEEYNINYTDLHQIKIVFPNTINPYKNLNIYKTLDKELEQYIDGKARYGMKKSTNDKKDALKSTKKTNPKKTKPKSNSKNKTYKYGRYDALNNGKCPNCGKAINRKAIRCIHCNYNFIENKVMPKTKGFEKVSGTSKIIEHDNYIGGYPKRHNSKPKKNVSSLYFHTISDIPKTTIENSSVKSKSKKCPNCGKLIKKSATKCIYCDYDLKVKRMENKPSYELVVDNNHDEKKYCQKCGRANPKDVKFCGWCGSKFGEIPNYCPNCDRLFNNQEMFCTECGSNLVNKSIYKRNTQKDKPKVKTKPKIIPKYNNVESKSGKDYKVKLDIKNQKTVDVDYGSENIYKNINPIDLELELEMATNKYHDCLKSGDMFMANYYKQKIDEIKRVLRF